MNTTWIDSLAQRLTSWMELCWLAALALLLIVSGCASAGLALVHISASTSLSRRQKLLYAMMAVASALLKVLGIGYALRMRHSIAMEKLLSQESLQLSLPAAAVSRDTNKVP